MSKSKMLNCIKAAFKITFPVMAGYLFLGVTFGLLIITSGFGWWVPILMSLVIYSGALEFAAVPVLLGAFNPLSTLILGITVSLRHLFYGLPMLKKYENIGRAKPFLIFGLTDETFSILSVQDVPDGISPKHFYFFVTLFDFLYWNIGTALGTILGNAVTVSLKGLDFALTALFIILFTEQLKTASGRISGPAGFAVSAAALLLFGGKGFVIPAMVLILIALMLLKGVADRE